MSACGQLEAGGSLQTFEIWGTGVIEGSHDRLERALLPTRISVRFTTKALGVVNRCILSQRDWCNKHDKVFSRAPKSVLNWATEL